MHVALSIIAFAFLVFVVRAEEYEDIPERPNDYPGPPFKKRIGFQVITRGTELVVDSAAVAAVNARHGSEIDSNALVATAYIYRLSTGPRSPPIGEVTAFLEASGLIYDHFVFNVTKNYPRVGGSLLVVAGTNPTQPLQILPFLAGDGDRKSVV